MERASGKTITVLNITSSKSSYYTDESITLTGALVDENDNPLSSTSVKLYQNNQLIDTLTTDSDGEFTKTLMLVHTLLKQCMMETVHMKPVHQVI